MALRTAAYFWTAHRRERTMFSLLSRTTVLVGLLDVAVGWGIAT